MIATRMPVRATRMPGVSPMATSAPARATRTMLESLIAAPSEALAIRKALPSRIAERTAVFENRVLSAAQVPRVSMMTSSPSTSDFVNATPVAGLALKSEAIGPYEVPVASSGPDARAPLFA